MTEEPTSLFEKIEDGKGARGEGGGGGKGRRGMGRESGQQPQCVVWPVHMIVFTDSVCTCSNRS